MGRPMAEGGGALSPEWKASLARQRPVRHHGAVAFALVEHPRTAHHQHVGHEGDAHPQPSCEGHVLQAPVQLSRPLGPLWVECIEQRTGRAQPVREYRHELETGARADGAGLPLGQRDRLAGVEVPE